MPYTQINRLTEAIILEIRGLCCKIECEPILKDLSLSIPAGSFCCLLGNSGSGKTTLLRMIGGLQECYSGEATLNGVKIIESGKSLINANQRGLGMVFQDYALFPHLNVKENLLFGLPKCSRLQKEKTIELLLNLVDLNGFEYRYPYQLSGGQQQRVALARALAPNPSFMLLDEPFSNIDEDQRFRLARQVKSILKHQQVSTLMVTHDQKEALMIADYVGILIEGQLVQWDTPYNLYHRPSSKAIAEFIGEGQWIDAQVKDHQTLVTPLGELQSERKVFCNAIQCCQHSPSQQLYIRSEDMQISAIKDNNTTPTRGNIICRVTEQTFAGFAILNYLEKCPQSNQENELPVDLHIPILCRDSDVKVGDLVRVKLSINEPILFPAS